MTLLKYIKLPKMLIRFTILTLLIFGGVAAHAKTVGNVTFEGNIAYGEDILQEYSLNPGDEYTADKLNQSIGLMLNNFEIFYLEADVIESGDSVDIVYRLVDNPRLSETTVEGNESIKDKEIVKKSKIKTDESINDKNLAESVNGIRKFYKNKGFYDATVDATFKLKEGNYTDIEYMVSENSGKARLMNIDFAGNDSIPAHELRSGLSNKERGFWSFATMRGNYFHIYNLSDQSLLIEKYKNKGFWDVKVSQGFLSKDEGVEHLRLRYDILEGEQYRYTSAEINSDEIYSSEELLEPLQYKQNDYISKSRLLRYITNVRNMYRKLGYAAVRVSYKFERVEGNLYNIVFTVDRGDIYTLNNITIEGNTSTYGRVILRNYRLNESEIYDGTKIDKGTNRIRGLRYFESIQTNEKLDPENLESDVDVKIKEGFSGNFNGSLTYSSVNYLGLLFTVDKNNFMGLGYNIGLSASYNQSNTAYSFNLLNPNLFDSQVIMDTKVYRSHNSRTYYRDTKTGIDNEYRMPVLQNLSENFVGSIGFGYVVSEIHSIAVGAPDYIEELDRLREGKEVRLGLAYTDYDNNFMPTEGTRTSGTFINSGGIVGGDIHYLETIFSHTRYDPYLSGNLIFKNKARFSMLFKNGDEPIAGDKYYLVGGTGTLRGYLQGYAGPKNDEGRPIGKKRVFTYRSELIYPLSLDVLDVFVFVDAAQVFDDVDELAENGLKFTAGPAVRWKTLFGLVDFSYGIKLNRDPEDDITGGFDLNLGGVF